MTKVYLIPPTIEDENKYIDFLILAIKQEHEHFSYYYDVVVTSFIQMGSKILVKIITK